MAAQKVLLIDDDEDFVQIHKSYLEHAGFKVLESYTGEEGLAIAKAEHPDIVVLDYMMARPTEGSFIALEIRDDPELKNTPIVLLTSVRSKHPWWGVQKNDEHLPVNVLLDKPISPERLVMEIQQLVSQK
jgi:CheY-like chemotaxis protein